MCTHPRSPTVGTSWKEENEYFPRAKSRQSYNPPPHTHTNLKVTSAEISKKVRYCHLWIPEISKVPKPLYTSTSVVAPSHYNGLILNEELLRP